MNVSFRPARREGPTFCGLTHRSNCAAHRASIRTRNGSHCATNLWIVASSIGFFEARAYNAAAYDQKAPPLIWRRATNSDRLRGGFSEEDENSLSKPGFASSYTFANFLSLARASSLSCWASSSSKFSCRAISSSAPGNRTYTVLQKKLGDASKLATTFE